MNQLDENAYSDVIVRIAKIDDLAAIFHLGDQLFRPQGASNLYRTWDEYEVTGLFNSEPEYMLVAEAGETIVGFALGSVIIKAGTAWNYGHLLWLGVDEACARRGIAGLLFDKFLALMKEQGIRMLMVDTQADNEAAIRFFRNKGFTNPIDHVYMTMNVENQGGA